MRKMKFSLKVNVENYGFNVYVREEREESDD